MADGRTDRTEFLQNVDLTPSVQVKNTANMQCASVAYRLADCFLYSVKQTAQKAPQTADFVVHSASRNGEFSQLWERLDADWAKKLWGIPH